VQVRHEQPRNSELVCGSGSRGRGRLGSRPQPGHGSRYSAAARSLRCMSRKPVSASRHRKMVLPLCTGDELFVLPWRRSASDDGRRGPRGHGNHTAGRTTDRVCRLPSEGFRSASCGVHRARGCQAIPPYGRSSRDHHPGPSPAHVRPPRHFCSRSRPLAHRRPERTHPGHGRAGGSGFSLLESRLPLSPRTTVRWRQTLR